MTNIIIEKKNGQIVKVVCDGHTGYGYEGEDIVCSAISSISQTAVLGLLLVAKIDVKMVRKDNEGYLEFYLPDKLSESQRHDADVILDTMTAGITDLYQEYSDYINLEVK